jgi:hypothetical protein
MAVGLAQQLAVYCGMMMMMMVIANNWQRKTCKNYAAM